MKNHPIYYYNIKQKLAKQNIKYGLIFVDKMYRKGTTRKLTTGKINLPNVVS